MKHYLQHLFKVPMFLIFVLAVAIYGFPALGSPAEISRYAIVTAIGLDAIDEEENKVEVSLLTFIPIAEQTFAETYKVISSKGRSVSEAMDLAGLHIGRQMGLSHVKTVILNTDLLQEDVTKFMDYLSRNKDIAASTKLIATDKKAKDFLGVVQKLDSESSIKISELVNFNNDYIYATDASFETFYKGLFGPTRVSYVPFLTVESEEEGGIEVANTNTQRSSGENTPDAKASTSGSEEIVNGGDTIFFKDGKAKVMLSGKDMKKVNLMRGNFTTGSIEIYDYTEDFFKNANLTFEIFGKDLKYRTTFQNGIPIVNVDLELTLSLSEVDTKDGSIEKNIDFFVVTEKCTRAIEEKVRKNVSEAVEFMRDNQMDICDFYTLMHNTDVKKFNNFLERLEDKDDYLNHIIFKMSVKIHSK